jgi:arginyl-tRNA synthetase
MSGRKGIGVKADDLLDQLQARSADQIRERYSDLPEDALAERARAVATGALRFFMVKATTTRKIAFDLEEALAFEGETGPYLQYSLVRERNIRQKLAAAGMATTVDLDHLQTLDSALWDDDLWDLVLHTAQIPETVTRGTNSLELSLIARAALDLAAKFHHAYHRHRILDEENEDLRCVRLAAFQVFRKGLIDLAELLGVPVLDQM